MIKRIMTFVFILLIITGCDRSSQNLVIDQSDITLVTSKNEMADNSIVSVETLSSNDKSLESALAELNLTSADILNKARFSGGMIGDKIIHGGIVFLWLDEGNRLSVQATIDGDDGWYWANNINHIALNPELKFIASAAIVNGTSDQDRKIPLWAFYGVCNDEDIEYVDVEYVGGSQSSIKVENGTWLVVHQGMISDITNEVVCTARNREYEVLYAETISLVH